MVALGILSMPMRSAAQGVGSRTGDCGRRAVGPVAIPCGEQVPVSTDPGFTCSTRACAFAHVTNGELGPIMYYAPLRTMDREWDVVLCGQTPPQCHRFQEVERYTRQALDDFYTRKRTYRSSDPVPVQLKDQLQFDRVPRGCWLLAWYPEGRSAGLPFAVSWNIFISREDKDKNSPQVSECRTAQSSRHLP